MKSNRTYNAGGILAGIIVVSLTQTGCLVLDEEHCLANGGDLACPGQRCLIQTGPHAETKSDEFGCSYTDANFPYHFHLTYGLPADFQLNSNHPRLDTVKGILSAWREGRDPAGSCRLGEEDEDLGEEYIDLAEAYDIGIHIVRTNIEDLRVSADQAALDSADGNALNIYNEAMDRWLDACSSKVASETSNSEMGS